MNLLAIDTSTDLASVALLVNNEWHHEEQGAIQSHARLLLPMIETLLADAKYKLSQLDGLVYGRGPGSFTGLRIACSIAKGLAYAHDLPLYPVSSLAAIANEAVSSESATAVLAMIDARMNQLYWAFFNAGQGELEQVSAPSEILPETQDTFIAAGVGYEPYLAQLPPAIQAKITKHSTVYPKADAMIRLVLSGKIKAVSAAEALPVYVRNQITQGESNG